MKLVRILQEKIKKIDESVGLDQTILGETVHPKVFGVIRRIKEKDSTVFEELEREIFGGGERFYQPLKEFLRKKARGEIEKIPNGIYSGLEKKSIKGIFFYYKYADEFHFWYLYDLEKRKFLNSKTEILDFISCREGEKRVIPPFFDEVYRINKMVAEEIEDAYKKIEQRKEDTSTKFFFEDRSPRFINFLIHEVEIELEDYLLEFPEDRKIQEFWDITRCKLQNIRLTKKRLREIRKMWRYYKDSHKNWKKLVKDLYGFVKDLPSHTEEKYESFDKNKLKLICIDFIC